MALVRKIQSAAPERHSTQLEVECTYSAFTDEKGDTYVQLNTFAVGATAANGTPKQVLRLDSQAAEQLVKILKVEFGPAAVSW